jgi:hypothetical protein
MANVPPSYRASSRLYQRRGTRRAHARTIGLSQRRAWARFALPTLLEDRLTHGNEFV